MRACITMLTCPRVIPCRDVLVIGLIAILVIASLALSAVAILDIWSSTARDGYEADQIPVVRNLVIPVPTPAAAEIKPLVHLRFQRLVLWRPLKPSLVPVPVPTPPL